jgi:maleamate amidohydrolase
MIDLTHVRGNKMTEGFEDHCWKDLVDAETLEIYAAYRRDVFVGPKPAVLAIDLYNKVYQGGPGRPGPLNRQYPGSCGENAWNALAPTIELLAAARRAGAPIVYTTRRMNTNNVHSTHRRHGPETEDLYFIKDEVAPHPGDLVIYKERASGFFGTSMTAHLRRLGVESLIFCGEATSGCVRASVTDAYSEGFHCVLAEETLFDTTMLCHKINLFDMHHKYADVMATRDVIAHLDGLTR